MGEFELISHFFAAAPCAQGGEGVALGIGDEFNIKIGVVQ